MTHDLSRTVRECALPVDAVIALGATIEEAMIALRKKQIQQKIIYFYAVDDAHKLKGVISARQLLLTDPSHKVEEIMQHTVVTVNADHTLHQAMELFSKHPLLALPVIDEEGKLVGAIDVQTIANESIDIANMRAREDLFQMIGLTLEDERKTSLFHSYRFRMPWLLCNVFSGIVCAMISNYYGHVLGKYLLLAFFIPLVLTLSESSSMQAVAQSLQFIRRPRFRWKIAIRSMIREWRIALLLGVSSGVLVGLLSLFWKEGLLPSLAIGFGILLGVVFSSAFGVAMPIVLHRLKLDPKVAAGPVVLMAADILTTAVYLCFAGWLLSAS